MYSGRFPSKTTSDARRPPTSPRSTSPAAFRASVSQLAADEPLMGGRPFRFPLGSNRQRLSPYVRSTTASKARTLPAKVIPASSARLTHSTTPAGTLAPCCRVGREPPAPTIPALAGLPLADRVRCHASSVTTVRRALVRTGPPYVIICIRHKNRLRDDPRPL
jgi:hypothetical protein